MSERRTSREHQVDDPTSVTSPPAPPDGVEDDDDGLPPGTLLGDYKIEARIGEGAMGVVYSAVHPMIGKKAAIKVLRRELHTDAALVQRFIDEARAVNQIGHPNIVDVFAFGKTGDDRVYFIMEWLKGRSLADRLDQQGPLSLLEICAVVKPLCRALEAAHEKEIIHRDLKPDNIFLVDVRGEQPTVKLLDFGIAKLVRSDRRMDKTATGAMIGTPMYIAPEQARGYAIDHRVDIYSLGGILYELFTGNAPFNADNAMDVVAKHLLETPPRLSASPVAATIPAEIDQLVFAMLAKDPAQRPTLQAVYEAFDRATAAAIMRYGALTDHSSSPVITPLPRSVVSPVATPVSSPMSSPISAQVDTATTIPMPPMPQVPLRAQTADVFVPEPARSSKLPLVIGALGAIAVGVVMFLAIGGGGGGSDAPETKPVGDPPKAHIESNEATKPSDPGPVQPPPKQVDAAPVPQPAGSASGSGSGSSTEIEIEPAQDHTVPPPKPKETPKPKDTPRPYVPPRPKDPPKPKDPPPKPKDPPKWQITLPADDHGTIKAK